MKFACNYFNYTRHTAQCKLCAKQLRACLDAQFCGKRPHLLNVLGMYVSAFCSGGHKYASSDPTLPYHTLPYILVPCDDTDTAPHRLSITVDMAMTCNVILNAKLRLVQFTPVMVR